MNKRTKSYMKIAITFVLMGVVAAISWMSPFGERTEKAKKGKK